MVEGIVVGTQDTHNNLMQEMFSVFLVKAQRGLVMWNISHSQ